MGLCVRVVDTITEGFWGPMEEDVTVVSIDDDGDDDDEEGGSLSKFDIAGPSGEELNRVGVTVDSNKADGEEETGLEGFGDGGRGTAETGAREGVLWTGGASVVTCVLGGFESDSAESGRTELTNFLCLVRGDGWGEEPRGNWVSDWTEPAEKGCRERRGEGRGAIGRGGREWTVEGGGPTSCPQAELICEKRGG